MGALVDTKAISDLALGLVNRFWPDKSEQEKQQIAGDLARDLGQIEVNKAEAATGNVFIAGWRPFIGWVCGAALLQQYIIGPLLAGAGAAVPALDVGDLIALVISMLGMGAYRTYEKRTGTEGNR